MFSIDLKNDIRIFNKHVKKIKREKPLVVALQDTPLLSEEDRITLILVPLNGEYNLFNGDILHKTDNLILVKREPYKVKIIRDNSGIEWMLKSKVNMLGILLESKGNSQGRSENFFRQLVFSIYVEPGAYENDIIENAYFIRKVMGAEKLDSDDLVLLCDHSAEESVRLIKRVLDIEVDAGSQRRTTRRR